jgi:hypothetical protein
MGIKEMVQRVRQHPGTWPTETKGRTVDEKILAHPRTSTEENKPAKFEERLRHELMDDEERQELRDRVLRLRRCLSR